MKALKGVVTYIGIVLLSLVLIGALIVGIMFFTKVSIFGYYFLQVNDNAISMSDVDLTNPLEDGGKYSISNVELNITTGRYAIVVQPAEDSRYISVISDNNYVGLVKATKTEDGNVAKTIPNIAQEVVVQGDKLKLTIKITEPEGVISYSDMSKIFVYVPFKINEKIISYDINATTKNGDIELTNSVDDKDKFEHPLTVSGLQLTTNKGDVTVKGFGDSEGKETKDLSLTNLNISTNGGTFDFTNFDSVTVKNKIILNSKKANYEFNNLKSHNSDDLTGGLEITGTTVKFNAHRVECGSDGFIYKVETGTLCIDKLYTGELNNHAVEITEKNSDGKEVETGKFKDNIVEVAPYENTIFTDSAVIELGVVVGKLGLYNEYGNVTINMLSNQASMRTENGNIYIKQSGVLLNEVDVDEDGNVLADKVRYADTSSLILYSTFGDITVGEYYQDAVIYSKKGKINVYSKFNGWKYEKVGTENMAPSRYFYSNISTKDGQITAKTDKNPMIIESTDSATINFTILDVLSIKPEGVSKEMNPFKEADMYQATSKNGTVNVEFPLKSYKVKVEADKIEGSIGATTNFGSEYVQINNEETNQPTIKIVGRKAKLKSAI